VKERFLFGAGIKITGLFQKDEVRDKARARHDVFAQFLELVRVKRNPAKGKGAHHDHEQSRENSLNPPGIEAPENSEIEADLFDQDEADQVTGNYKEDVDTSQAAWHDARKEVVNDYSDHSQGSQPVYVWPIPNGRRSFLEQPSQHLGGGTGPRRFSEYAFRERIDYKITGRELLDIDEAIVLIRTAHVSRDGTPLRDRIHVWIRQL
jgi:hypothetical protein